MQQFKVETAARFSIPVDYSSSLASLVAAGRYDLVDPKVSEKHFSSGTPGHKRAVSVRLLYFGRLMMPGDLEQEMLRHTHSRLATLHELLALGIERPDIQREFPLVGAGSSCKVGQSPGVWQVPYLAGSTKERRLCLGARNFGWSDAFRFLVVQT